jgi:hypothetical protein
MTVAMENSASAALDISGGRPTTVRGPDGVLYLFSLENSTPTARPCAAVGLGAAPSMQWFYVQRLSASASGAKTDAQYLGPFYGDPSAVSPFMRLGDYVLVFVNGAWTEL